MAISNGIIAIRSAHQGVVFAAIFAILLGACTSKVEQAEAEYEMAKRNGAGSTELCRRAREIEEAYLDAGNEEGYKTQKLYADIECSLAQYNPS